MNELRVGKKEIKIKIVITGTRRELDKTKTELEKTRAGLSKTVNNLSEKLNGIFCYYKNPLIKILMQNTFSINLETETKLTSLSTEFKGNPKLE